MYLAGVLILCALHACPRAGSGSLPAGGLLVAVSARIAALPQEPAKPDQSKSENSPPGQAKPDAGAEKPESGQASPSEPPSAPARTPPAKTPPGQKPARTAKKNGAKKKPASGEAAGNSKTVVREGSTSEPTTQLAPGMTAEHAAQQRKSTNKLLSDTDSALQKLSGRLLNTDEQNTVAQIRKFMQQAKAADSDGDLELSYKLALKAHLLSEALSKP